MSRSVSNPTHRRDNRHRLGAFILIGLLMAGAALAGYATLGSHTSPARPRPAEIATHVPVIPHVQLNDPADTHVTSEELAAMQAEMQVIARRADQLLAQQPAPPTPTPVPVAPTLTSTGIRFGAFE